MEIQCLTSNLLKSNMYIITENKHCIIIDPCQNIDCYVSSFDYDFIILTHEHYDHISGVNVWKDLTNAKVLCSQECSKLIQDPKKNFSHHFQAFAELQTMLDNSSIPYVEDYSCQADETFSDEYSINWCGHKLKLFETPGHSEGSSCLLIDDQYLFSGDTLFHNYETALRFPGGSKKKWENITKPKIKKLDDEIIVYPGHFEYFKLKDWIGND